MTDLDKAFQEMEEAFTELRQAWEKIEAQFPELRKAVQDEFLDR